MQRHCLLLFLLIGLLVLTGCSTGRNGAVGGASEAVVDLMDPATMPVSVSFPLIKRGDYYLVASRVNGQTTGPMLVDTGSTLTIVDTGTANRLQLPVVGTGETTGIAGRERIEFRQARSVTAGGVGIDHSRLAALSMRRIIGGGGLTLGGLVGFTAFAGHPFTFDFPGRTITVYRRDAFRPPADARRYRLTSFRGLPAITAELGGGQEVLLIIDSGANNAVSLPHYVADWPRILATHVSAPGQSRGVGGQIQTQQTWLRRVRLLGLELDGLPVTFEPQPAGLSSNRYPIGRIGTLALSTFRLTFDLKNRSVWIAVDPEAHGG